MKTEFSIEEIEAAIQDVKHCQSTDKDIVYATEFWERLQRPKHEFREGEVVRSENGNLAEVVGNVAATSIGTINLAICRPLRLSEMPKAVEDLRESLRPIAALWADERGVTSTEQYNLMSRAVLNAIAAFDSAIEKGD